MSTADIQRDLIADRHILPRRLFPLSLGDRDAALIPIENGYRESQARTRLEALRSLAIGIINRVQIHELISSQTRSLTGRFNGDLGSTQIGSHGKRVVDEDIDRFQS